MATKKKGILSTSKEWAKHLRKDGKKSFWSSERYAVKQLIKKEVKTL